MVLVGVGASFCRRPDYPAGVAPAVVRAMRRRLQQQRAQVVGDFYALMLAPTEKAWEGPLSSLLPSSLAALPLEEGLDYLLQKDLRPSLLNLPGVPLVVVQGEQDRISPQTQAQYWKDQVPAARLEIYPEVGHLPFLTQAERFNKLLVELLHEDR
jgi:pimeloyl-[acyl-carrier protein] methyl ester esterase